MILPPNLKKTKNNEKNQPKLKESCNTAFPNPFLAKPEKPPTANVSSALLSAAATYNNIWLQNIV